MSILTNKLYRLSPRNNLRLFSPSHFFFLFLYGCKNLLWVIGFHFRFFIFQIHHHFSLFLVFFPEAIEVFRVENCPFLLAQVACVFSIHSGWRGKAFIELCHSLAATVRGKQKFINNLLVNFDGWRIPSIFRTKLCVLLHVLKFA